MPIPNYQAIMLPLLGLAADEKVHRVRDAVHRLELHFNLDVDERREPMPDGRRSRFSYNLAWARTYLKKAGLVEDPRRGEFRITGRGKEVLARKPAAIDSRLLQQFDEFNDFMGRSPSPDTRVQPHPDYTPEDALIAACQTLRNSLAADLLEQVRRSSPMFFEQLVVDVLVRMGYGGSRKEAGEAIGQAGDEGIDGIIEEDRLGLDIIYIQAKRWENTVGRLEVQRFVGALEGNGRARESS